MVPNASPDAAAGRLLHADADPVDVYLRSTDGAVSAATQRAVKADLKAYAAWCAEHGMAALPAEPATVAAFVDAMARLRAPATVRRYVSSIAAAQSALGCATPVRTPAVCRALKRMHRRRGRRQKQVHGLTWPLLQRLLAVPGERVIDARNRALVAVAYDALLRRSELTAVRVADLLVDVRGSATLIVTRGKTDPEGHGAAVYLARDTVTLVREWLDRAGVTDGRLFRSVAKGGTIGARLHPSQIPRILKAMASRAGLPARVVEQLSGHSARVGAAQDMVASGIEMPAILQAGRWKTAVMVNRYGERLLASRSGAAQLARLQRRD